MQALCRKVPLTFHRGGGDGCWCWCPAEVARRARSLLRGSGRPASSSGQRRGPPPWERAKLIPHNRGCAETGATRSGGATVAAAYSPRARPGLPVSFPVTWDELDHVTPADFTILTAIELLGDRNPWQAALAAPQMIPADLVAEGHEIPIPRVAAMHEGKRRANARRKDEPDCAG